jgi:hypothetical protein
MATLAEQITEAEAAYHSLVTGKAARVIVDQNGERVEFIAANRAALYSYIQDLKSQLDPELPPRSSPVRFIF